MKFLIVFFALVALTMAQYFAINENNVISAKNLQRVKKNAYAAPSSSYSAPPCPQNYLFSCSPQLKPVPCSQQDYSASLGSVREYY